MKIRLYSILALCLLGLASCSKQVPNPLIAYWAFDGNTLDSAVHHHNATPVGNIHYGADRFGHPGKALVLDGHAYLTVPDSIDLRLSNDTPFTISAWIKTGDTNQASIIWKGSENFHTLGYKIELEHRHLHAQINAVGGMVDLYDSTHSTADNRWHLITLLCSSDSDKLYRDTTLVSAHIGTLLTPKPGIAGPMLMGTSASLPPGSSILAYMGLFDNFEIQVGWLPPGAGGMPPIAGAMPGYPPGAARPVTGQILGMCWVDSMTGYSCGQGGKIYSTSNGGASWNSMHSGTQYNIRRISFSKTGLNGVAVGDNGTVLYIDASGLSNSTWSPSSVTWGGGLPDTVSDVKFLSDGTVIMVGGYPNGSMASGFVEESVNYGQLWTPVTIYSGQELYCISECPPPTGSNVGFCVAGAEGIYEYGESSGAVALVTPDYPFTTIGRVEAIDFDLNTANGVAVTDAAIVYQNLTGSWTGPTSVGTNTPTALYAAVAVGANDALVAGADVSGGCWDAPLRTGVTNWNSKLPQLLIPSSSYPWSYICKQPASKVFLITTDPTPDQPVGPIPHNP